MKKILKLLRLKTCILKKMSLPITSSLESVVKVDLHNIKKEIKRFVNLRLVRLLVFCIYILHYIMTFSI